MSSVFLFGCAGQATNESQPARPEDGEVTIEGIAADAKLTAVIQAEDGTVPYVDRIPRWGAFQGMRVRVHGYWRRGVRDGVSEGPGFAGVGGPYDLLVPTKIEFLMDPR